MTTPSTQPVAVLGAGSWGTALAILLSRGGRPAILWGRNSEHMAALAAERCNQRYLDGIPFPETLKVSSDLVETVAATRDILTVVPSRAFRSMLQALAPLITPESRLIWATKGLEPTSGKLLHQVVDEELPDEIPRAVISGPTFAKEVAAGLPTALTVASPSLAFAQDVANRLHDETFRAYTSNDVVGVQLGGAVKNVLAIAAGISDGLGFGANARAALVTRGLVEIMRLGEAIGGQRETFMGLAGLGDLVLTCTDNQSRNRRFGLALAKGDSTQQALAAIGQEVEGLQTARVVEQLAQRAGVETPICEQTYRVLYEGLPPREAVHNLLARAQKPEAS